MLAVPGLGQLLPLPRGEVLSLLAPLRLGGEGGLDLLRPDGGGLGRGPPRRGAGGGGGGGGGGGPLLLELLLELLLHLLLELLLHLHVLLVLELRKAPVGDGGARGEPLASVAGEGVGNSRGGSGRRGSRGGGGGGRSCPDRPREEGVGEEPLRGGGSYVGCEVRRGDGGRRDGGGGWKDGRSHGRDRGRDPGGDRPGGALPHFEQGGEAHGDVLGFLGRGCGCRRGRRGGAGDGSGIGRHQPGCLADGRAGPNHSARENEGPVVPAAFLRLPSLSLTMALG